MAVHQVSPDNSLLFSRLRNIKISDLETLYVKCKCDWLRKTARKALHMRMTNFTVFLIYKALLLQAIIRSYFRSRKSHQDKLLGGKNIYYLFDDSSIDIVQVSGFKNFLKYCYFKQRMKN